MRRSWRSPLIPARHRNLPARLYGRARWPALIVVCAVVTAGVAALAIAESFAHILGA